MHRVTFWWRLRSMLGATIAGFGWRRYSGYAPWAVQVPGPWWRRWRFGPVTASPPPGVRYAGPPPWQMPPENELGVAVPVRAILASDSNYVIGLIDCVAFSTGFEFSITARTKHEIRSEDMGFGPPPPHGPDRSDKELRIGIQFATGASAMTGRHPNLELMAGWKLHAEGGAPDPADGPIISPRSGSGGGKRWDFRYWVWPLPPEGKLTFIFEWPALGLAPTAHDVDASAISRAGATSANIWTDT